MAANSLPITPYDFYRVAAIRGPQTSSLISWCKSVPAIRSGCDHDGSAIPSSHTSMDGCTKALHVDDSMLNAFYLHAAKGWHEATFLSELGSPVHILFFDLDLYVAGNSQWREEDTVRTVRFFLYQLTHLVADNNTDILKCIITHVEPEVISAEGRDDRVKIGIHMYFPLAFVDIETHRKLRSVLLIAATERAEDRVAVRLEDHQLTEVEQMMEEEEEDGFTLTNSWADALDLQVVKVPALRMVCSSKCTKCSHTPEERQQLKCKAKGHLANVGRRYNVVDVLIYNKQTMQFERDGRDYNTYTNLSINESGLTVNHTHTFIASRFARVGKADIWCVCSDFTVCIVHVYACRSRAAVRYYKLCPCVPPMNHRCGHFRPPCLL